MSEAGINDQGTVDQRGVGDEDTVEKFLEKNNVLKEWKDLILQKDDVKTALDKCFVRFVVDKKCGSFVPEHTNILKALTYCPPLKIRAVIIGNDPIPGRLATGLAFCLPDDGTYIKPNTKRMHAKEYSNEDGVTMKRLYDVLCSCEFLEEGRNYSKETIEWAKKGVLLLNGCLTNHESIDDIPKKKKKVWDYWVKFVACLLQKFDEIKPNIPYLCMGTCGMEVGKQVAGPEGKSNVTLCHHPTYPRPDQEENRFVEVGQIFFREIRDNKDTKELFCLTPLPDTSEESSREAAKGIKEISINETADSNN